MNKLLWGAIAGFAATVPMTIAMKLMHKELPNQERYPLPPRLIIEEVTEETKTDDDLNEAEKYNLTMFSHFSYGAATGAIYGAGIDQMNVRSNALTGTAFGLTVWTVSYLGLLPALGILTPATEHPMRRNALMIAAHIVWGISLGEILRLANSDRKGEIYAEQTQ